MAKDDVAICNAALRHIGVSLKIESLTNPRSKEAIVLADCFEEVRDRVLQAAPWPFARRISLLQLTGLTPVKWAYRYEYPNDCLAVRALFPASASATSPALFRQMLKTAKTSYEMETDDDDSLTICTDLKDAAIEYTKRVTNPARFDALFSGTLEWALAAEIALPLAKTVDYARNAQAQCDRLVAEAIAKAFNEETPDAPPDSEFVLARL